MICVCGIRLDRPQSQTTKSSACRLPGFPLWKHVALVGKGQNLAGSSESDYKCWHMDQQIVPHSVHQVCAIFTDWGGKKKQDMMDVWKCSLGCSQMLLMCSVSTVWPLHFNWDVLKTKFAQVWFDFECLWNSKGVQSSIATVFPNLSVLLIYILCLFVWLAGQIPEIVSL